MAIDVQEARRFVVALTGRDDTRCCWQVFPDHQEDKDDAVRRRELTAHRDLSLANACVWLEEMNARRAGVYVTVNATDGHGRKTENVTGLRALFVDCDGTTDLADVAWPVMPGIIVQRDATHWHAYWILEEGEPTEAFTRAQVQLAAYFNADFIVSDLSRVMRMPGFDHHKGDPIRVHLVRAERELHPLAAIVDAHPVDWSTMPEPYRKKAQACGLIEADPRPAPTSRPREQRDEHRSKKPSLFDMTRAWMLKLDTREGKGNDRGGRDRTAFHLACECAGRDLDERDATELVSEYFARSGGGGDADVTRVVRSAYSRPRNTRNMPHLYDPNRREEEAPRRDRVASVPSPSEDVFGDPEGEPAETQTPVRDGGDDGANHDGGGGNGGSGGGSDAGGTPPGWRQWSRDLDIELIKDRWSIGSVGVWPLKLDRDGSWSPRPNDRVADLPIWPVQQGVDVATGSSYWLVRWQTPAKAIREQWLPELDLKLGLPLVALPDAPVPKRTSEACAAWLTAARVAVRAESCRVTSRVGWCGVGDARTWVWPSEGGVRYIGTELGEAGDLEVWRSGVDHLVELGEAGLPGLVALGYAAGAAWSRLNGATPRNPILGLMGPSSTGKGTILGYALSMWCHPDHLSLPASSTAKGLQDRATGIPDLPILVDELQQLAERDPRQAADALYYLANGQRRITSSKSQTAVGGERRYGAGFYAAEAPILQGQNEGVQLRVIELADVAFVPSEASAKAIQSGIRAAGAPAGALAAHLNATSADAWRVILHGYAEAWRSRLDQRRGDDALALTLLQVGLEGLGAILDADLRPQVVCAWLAERLAQQRAVRADRETTALHAILDAVLNSYWKDDDKAGPGRAYTEGVSGQPVAWRLVAEEPGKWGDPDETTGATKTREVVAQLDINPAADLVRRLIIEHGGQERLLRAWAKRGWIKTDGRHLTVRKTHRGAPIGRVVRFTGEALQTYLDLDPASAMHGATPPKVILPPIEDEPPF